MSCAPVNRARTFGYSCGAGVMCASEFKHFHTKKVQNTNINFFGCSVFRQTAKGVFVFFRKSFSIRHESFWVNSGCNA